MVVIFTTMCDSNWRRKYQVRGQIAAAQTKWAHRINTKLLTSEHLLSSKESTSTPLVKILRDARWHNPGNGM